MNGLMFAEVRFREFGDRVKFMASQATAVLGTLQWNHTLLLIMFCHRPSRALPRQVSGSIL